MSVCMCVLVCLCVHVHMCVSVCVRERGGGRMDRQTDRQTEGVCLSHVFILGIGLSFCPLAHSQVVAGPL